MITSLSMLALHFQALHSGVIEPSQWTPALVRAVAARWFVPPDTGRVGGAITGRYPPTLKAVSATDGSTFADLKSMIHFWFPANVTVTFIGTFIPFTVL